MDKFDIFQIPDFHFDADKIYNEIETALGHVNLKPTFNQINLYHTDKTTNVKDHFLFLAGSLSIKMNDLHTVISESEFIHINPLLKGTYTEQVCEEIRKYSEQTNNYKVGRIRFLGLSPKTCYSWHTDPDLIRYHIPLKTNEGSFFVVENGVYRMPDPGSVYSILSTKPHTAVNASINNHRYHIVFDTYVEGQINPYDPANGLTNDRY